MPRSIGTVERWRPAMPMRRLRSSASGRQLIAVDEMSRLPIQSRDEKRNGYVGRDRDGRNDG
jgi:hypothetical protein